LLSLLSLLRGRQTFLTRPEAHLNGILEENTMILHLHVLLVNLIGLEGLDEFLLGGAVGILYVCLSKYVIVVV
jgi:hypothetical protein